MSGPTHIRLLRGSGLLLFLLSIVHLAATPHISRLIWHLAPADAAARLTPPMLLNHVAVGLLLLPLGYLTFYAAPHSAASVKWAQMIVRTVAVSVAALPLALLALMGTRYFDGPLFVVGTVLVLGAAATLLVAAFSTPRDSLTGGNDTIRNI